MQQTVRWRITKEHHDGQEAEPERLSLSDHFVLCRKPGALHVRRGLHLQGRLHVRQGLRLLDREVDPIVQLAGRARANRA
jgi:hypothetical protein